MTDNLDWFYSQPRKPCEFYTQLDLDAPVNWPNSSWGLACLIGMCRSDLVNGYPDEFDAVDQEDYAVDLMSDGQYLTLPISSWTLGDLLKDCAGNGEDPDLSRVLQDMGA